MKKLIAILFSLVCFSVFVSAQTALPLKLSIQVKAVEYGNDDFLNDKRESSDEKVTLTKADGSTLITEVGLNTLYQENFAAMNYAEGDQSRNKVTLGYIKQTEKNSKIAGRNKAVEFEITVGNDKYFGRLVRFGAGLAAYTAMVLMMPESIRIPLDREKTLILNFTKDYFPQEEGIYPITANFTFESSNPPQRRTRRR